jgi:hypothetical protein
MHQKIQPPPANGQEKASENLSRRITSSAEATAMIEDFPGLRVEMVGAIDTVEIESDEEWQQRATALSQSTPTEELEETPEPESI